MRKRYHRFLQRNRNKGIPNLMLYICIGNALLYFYVLMTENLVPVLYLSFDLASILRGQIWRCVTWLFVYGVTYISETLGPIYIIFFILFNHWLGRVLESVWGTLRLNLYYLGGALMMLIAAILMALLIGWQIQMLTATYYLNISLMLAVATLIPEERIMLFGIFPLKMRWLAWLDLALIALGILRSANGLGGISFAIAATAPLVSILNYVLHFGKDVSKLFPIKSSYKQRKRRQQFQKAAAPNPNWADNYRSSTGERPYRHKCTVCGRTDTANPGLEFRYCSRCKGYFCYCIDHINQHTHIE